MNKYILIFNLIDLYERTGLLNTVKFTTITSRLTNIPVLLNSNLLECYINYTKRKLYE